VVALCDAGGDFARGPEATETVAHFLADAVRSAMTADAMVSAFQRTCLTLGPKFIDDMGIHASWSTAAGVLTADVALVAWAGATGAAHIRNDEVLWRSTPHLLRTDWPEGLPLRTVVGRLQADPRTWAPPQVQTLQLQPGDVVLLYSRSVEKLFFELEGDRFLIEKHPVPLVNRLCALAQWPPSVVEVRALE